MQPPLVSPPANPQPAPMPQRRRRGAFVTAIVLALLSLVTYLGVYLIAALVGASALQASQDLDRALDEFGAVLAVLGSIVSILMAPAALIALIFAFVGRSVTSVVLSAIAFAGFAGVIFALTAHPEIFS